MLSRQQKIIERAYKCHLFKKRVHNFVVNSRVIVNNLNVTVTVPIVPLPDIRVGILAFLDRLTNK